MPESALTRTMQAMSGRTAWLLAAGFALVMPVGGILAVVLPILLADPRVTVSVVAAVPNQSGTMIVVVERVVKDMGFDYRAISDELHLLRKGVAVTGHGNDSDTVLFSESAFMAGRAPPDVEWDDDRHLTVTYGADGDDGPRVRQRDGVTIAYVKRAPAQ